MFSDSWDTHIKRLPAVLRRLSEAKLTINLVKCEFARATVTYLGKVVGNGEVGPVHAKIQAIQTFPVPVTKKELMRSLGLVGYYRSFCRNLSTVVAPLTDLLKSKVKFVWSSKCAVAFENVKDLLCSSPVLACLVLTSRSLCRWMLVRLVLELFFSSLTQQGSSILSVFFHENSPLTNKIIWLWKKKRWRSFGLCNTLLFMLALVNQLLFIRIIIR